VSETLKTPKTSAPPLPEASSAALYPTPTTVNDAADAMLDDLELGDLSKRTYRHGLVALVRYLHANAGSVVPNADHAADAVAPFPLSELSEETLAGFSRWLRAAYRDPASRPATTATGAGNGPVADELPPPTRTARTYMVAARRLMNWLDLRGLLPPEVTYERMVRRIDAGRGQRRQGYRQRRVDPQVMRVLGHYMRQPLPERPGIARLTLLRNRALMAILYDTGMRISEALALRREDVLDGRATRVRLTETKNGKPRTVFLSDQTRRLLRDYTRERSDSVHAPLFVSHGRNKGTAITASHGWYLVKQAAKAEGLYKNTSPHSLRHRRAQDLLDEGMPLEWVAALLGHQHPDTTRVVYAWETDEERLGDMVATYGLKPLDVASKRDSLDDLLDDGDTEEDTNSG
jgi:integrase